MESVCAHQGLRRPSDSLGNRDGNEDPAVADEERGYGASGQVSPLEGEVGTLEQRVQAQALERTLQNGRVEGLVEARIAVLVVPDDKVLGRHEQRTHQPEEDRQEAARDLTAATFHYLAFCLFLLSLVARGKAKAEYTSDHEANTETLPEAELLAEEAIEVDRVHDAGEAEQRRDDSLIQAALPREVPGKRHHNEVARVRQRVANPRDQCLPLRLAILPRSRPFWLQPHSRPHPIAYLQREPPQQEEHEGAWAKDTGAREAILGVLWGVDECACPHASASAKSTRHPVAVRATRRLLLLFTFRSGTIFDDCVLHLSALELAWSIYIRLLLKFSV